VLCSSILNESYIKCELNIEYKSGSKVAQKQNIEMYTYFRRTYI